MDGAFLSKCFGADGREFSNAGLFTLAMLMFIGASPRSTGG
nr:hypothetical protein [Blautia producta]